MSHPRFVLVAAACVVFVTTASATASTAGTVGSNCYESPGVLKPGVYTTRCFLPGMRIRLPGGWQAVQDSTTEFKLTPPHSTDPDTPALRFWVDPHASTPCTDKALPVDISTPTKVVDWLRRDRNVVVSTPSRTTIGRGLKALRVDLDTSARAPRCSSACPGPCVDYFLFRAPGVPTEPYGTGRGELVQLYFAHIAPPGHLLVFAVDTPNARTFRKLTASARSLLATVRMPAKLPPRRGR